MEYSVSEENYIKTIFHLQQKLGKVTTNELANHMKTRPASITDMLKKLKKRNLVHYQPYQGFKLSIPGKKAAIEIIRRHRLWEFFLADRLKFNWDEVHEMAEQLEHLSNKKLIDKLEEYLAFPKFDPHGDPIPDINGKIDSTPRISLDQWPINKPAYVSQVIYSSPELLELLSHHKITIGTVLEIKKRFEYDGSIEIKINQRAPVTISETLAKIIFVQHGSTHQ
jgi:DtxR family Mn-dependent transcriptional regulator